MLPEVERLEALSQDNNDYKFYSNDNEHDLGDVLELVFGEKYTNTYYLIRTVQEEPLLSINI